jgi:dephospho-CoA kinase
MRNTVVLFCGAAGSGKDTSFNMFQTCLNKLDESIQVSQFAFGRPLKEIVSDLCQLFLNETYSVEDMNRFSYKELARPEHTVYSDLSNPDTSEPLIIRRLLQIIGTDFLRKRLGDDVFATAVLCDIDAFFEPSGNGQGVKVACITDLRFPNEQKCVRDYCEARGYNCITVYIRRTVVSPKSLRHISESHYDRLEKDFIIENCGTIEELENEVDRLVSYVVNVET